MRVLITRPEPDGSVLAGEIAALGHDPLLAPLMQVEFDDHAACDLAGVQAIAFTSANGVRAFCRQSRDRRLPVFAVGAATAQEAAKEGFPEASTADGDVETLAALIQSSLDPQNGAIFHPSGAHVAGDLAGRLSTAGFAVRSQKMYTAVERADLPAPVRDAFERQRLDVALFFSPRTASIFAKLVAKSNDQSSLRPVVALCMSQNVATAIKSLPFAEVHVSSAPTKEAVLAALEELAS